MPAKPPFLALLKLAAWFFFLPRVLTAGTDLFQIGGSLTSLTDVSPTTQVYFQSMRFNRATNQWNFEIVVHNSGTAALGGPLIVLLDSYQNTSGPLQPDGTDLAGKPFIDLTVQIPGAALDPGAQTTPRTVAIGVTSGSPTLSTKVYAPSASGGLALAFVRTLNQFGQPLPAVTITASGPAGIATNFSDLAYGIATVGQGQGSNNFFFSMPGFLPAWRTANLLGGAVQILPNPRLIPLGSNTVSIPGSGGVIADPTGAIQITAGGGTFPAGAQVWLTPIAAQALPAPLPTGWSPLTAFWLELSTEPSVPLNARLQLTDNLGHGEIGALVHWDTNSLTWQVSQLVVGLGSAIVTPEISGSGAWCLVVADAGGLSVPAMGQTLPAARGSLSSYSGVGAVASVTPPSSPASTSAELVTSVVQVTVTNAAGPIPSGTLFQGEVTETYQMSDGSTRYLPSYEEFLTSFQRPAAAAGGAGGAAASFAWRPRLLFGQSQLIVGRVRLDTFPLLPFDGSLFTPTNSGVITNTNVSLSAFPGDLSQPQAVRLATLNITNYAALAGGLTVVQAFDLTLAAVATNQGLTLSCPGLATNSQFVLARLLYQGVYGLQPVQRLATDASGNLSSAEPSTGPRLAGITGSGQYMLVQVPGPQALVSGFAMGANGQPTAGLELNLAPWVTLSASDGSYQLVAPAGQAQLSVVDLVGGNAGATSFQIPSGQTYYQANVSVTGTGPVVLAVSPNSGATSVSTVAPIQIQFSKPISPGTVTTNTVQLTDPTGQVVDAELALNLTGDSVTILPVNPLAAQTLYTLNLSTNVTDLGGTALSGQTAFTFTTAPSTFVPSPGAVLTSYEPTNGVAPITGTAGFAEPGQPVILVNETTLQTTTVLANSDGSFSGTVAANVDAQLSVTVVNEDGTRNTVSVEREVFADGSVALGSQGGTIEVPGENGPIQIIVAQGAIANKTRLGIVSVPLTDALATMTNTEPIGGQVVGAFKLSAIQGDPLTQALDVSFPVDISKLNLPPGTDLTNVSFGLAIGHITADGAVYELVDRMLYEDGNLVTHSPPFFGLLGPFEDLLVMPLLMAVGELQLVVNGRVYAAQFDPVTEVEVPNTRQYLPGALVSGIPSSSGSFIPGRLRPGTVYTTSQADGSYTLLVTVDDTDPSHSVGVRAESPYFPGIDGSSTLPPDLTAGFRFAIGNILTPQDVVFVLPEASGHAPPTLTISQSLAQAQPGDTNTLTLVSTGTGAVPTIAGGFQGVVSLDPTVSVSPADVTVTAISQTAVGNNGTRAIYTVVARLPAIVNLAFSASDLRGGLVTTPYSLMFGGANPPIQDTIPVADTNNVAGPQVVRTDPGEGDNSLAPGDPIVLWFDKPLASGSVTNPAAISISPAAGTPSVSLSSDQLSLTVQFPGIMAGTTNYTLTLSPVITDLQSHPLNATAVGPQGAAFSLHFGAAPVVVAKLPQLQVGSGAIIRGIYGYALDQSGDLGSLDIYDLSIPSAPSLVTSYTLPAYPRDLVLIPSYSFKRRTNSIVETKDMIAVVGGLTGEGNVPWLRVVDISNPAIPVRMTGTALSEDSADVVSRVLWSPPQIGYLENGTVSAISVIDLQTLILYEYLTPAEIQQLPLNGSPGLDADGNGDYVGPNDLLPIPALNPVDFDGKVFSYTVPDTDQEILDFSFNPLRNYVAALLDNGHLLDTNGVSETNVALTCYRTLISGDLALQATNASYTFTNPPFGIGILKRLYTLFDFPLTVSNRVSLANLALVTWRSIDPNNTTNELAVLNITDPTNPQLLSIIPIPQNSTNQGAFSIERLANNYLSVASENGTYLIDPNTFSGAPGAASAGPKIGSIAGFIPVLGGGVKSYGLSDSGLTLAASGGLNKVVQTAPGLEFITLTNAPFSPTTILNQTNGFYDSLLLNASVASTLRPANTCPNSGDDALNPPSPAVHYYVVVHAPGSAGPTIDLALESLDWASQPLRKRGFLFPPVNALGSNTLEILGQTPGTNDAPVRASTAWRLTSDMTSPYYNVYLSRPFALVTDGMTLGDLSNSVAQLDRDILWSGAYVRASIEPSEATNTAIGPFASAIDLSRRALSVGPSASAQAFPADYLQSPNPGPIAGEVFLPSVLNALSPHNSELNINDVDLQLSGRRLTFEFRRNYSGQSLYDGPFGRGWDFNYNQRVIELAASVAPPSGQIALSGSSGCAATNAVSSLATNPIPDIASQHDLIFYGGGGRAIAYHYAGGGTNPPDGVLQDPLLNAKGWVNPNPLLTPVAGYYLPPDGLFDLFLKFKDGSYVRVEPDGMEYWYHPSGRLDKIYDRYEKNAISMVYNQRGELITILDELLRPIQVGWWRLPTDALYDQSIDMPATNTVIAGRIARLKDYSNRDVLFYYTPDGLLEHREGVDVETVATVDNVTGFTGRQVTRYAYSGTTNADVTGQSLVGVRSDGLAGTSLLSVSGFSGNGRDNVSEITMLSGTGSTPRKVKVSQVHGNTTAAMQANGGLNSIVGSDGGAMNLMMDGSGRVTNSILTSAGGDKNSLTNTTEYYDNGYLQATTTPEGTRTEYTYDFGNVVFRARGNRIQVLQDPGPRSGDVLVSTNSFDAWYSLPSGYQADFNTNVTTISLSPDHRDTLYVLKDGKMESFSVNEYGQMQSHTTISGVKTTYNYDDSAGWLTSQQIGQASQVTVTYSFTPNSTVLSDYTLRGLPSSIIDGNGVVTTYHYDELNRVVDETRSDLFSQRAYDSLGNAVAVSTVVETGRSRVEHNDYNSFGLLLTNTIRQVETDGTSRDMVSIRIPDELNRIQTVITPSGEQISVLYDEFGRITNSATLNGPSESFQYDADGNITNRTVGQASESYVFDGHNRLTQVIFPSGAVTTSTLDGNGNVTARKINDANGVLMHWTEYSFDALNRLRKTTRHRDNGIATSSTDFDEQNRITTLTDALSNIAQIYYDDSGRIFRHVMPTLQRDMRLDGNANKTNTITTEALGTFQTIAQYNALNQLTNVIDNAGNGAGQNPGVDGRILSTTDREGHTAVNGFTILGEVLTNTNPNGVLLSYTYSSNRLVDAVLDGAGNIRREFFDEQDRLLKAVLPNGQFTTFTNFNPFNEPTTETMPMSVSAVSSYDIDGKVTNRVISVGGVPTRRESWNYDAIQRPVLLTDPSGSYGFSYDLGGFIKSNQTTYTFQIPVPVPATLAFSQQQNLDPAEFRTNVTYPSGALNIALIREQNGRLSGIQPQGLPAVLTGTAWSGELTFSNRTLGPGLILESHSFDELQRMAERRYTRIADGQMLVATRYAYDKDGAQTARQYLHRAGRADVSTYDAGYRLSRADLDARPVLTAGESSRTLAGFPAASGFAPGKYARAMSYTGTDVLTNIATINPDNLAVPAQASVFGPPDEMLFVKQADGFSRSDDLVGNVTRENLLVRLPGSPTPQWIGATLSYNELGQVTTATRDDGVVVRNEYNPAGYRIRRRVEGDSSLCVPSDRAFIYDGARLIEERDLENAAALLGRYYYSDDSDELLAADLAQSDGLHRYYYLLDSLKSVLAVADDMGNVVERVRYDAWGQPSLELPDTTPPVVQQVTYDQTSLLIVFSEPVLPPPNVSGSGLFQTAPDPSPLFTVSAGGQPVPGSVTFEENLAGVPFGTAYRFVPTAALGTNATLRIGAGLIDDWGNTNTAFSAVLTLPASGAASVFGSPGGQGTGATPIPRSSVGSSFLFHGQYFDYETGLVYCRARYYNPALATFLERDPAGQADGVNPYAAFANNPANFRDPTGQKTASDFANYLNEWGSRDASKESSLSRKALKSAAMSLGSVLNLGTSWAEGADLCESKRQGTYGLLDRLKGANLMIQDIHNAMDAYGKIKGFVDMVGVGASLGRAAVGAAKGYMQALQMRRQAQLGEVERFLYKRGQTHMEMTAYLNAMEQFRKEMGAQTVELGIRSFKDKAQSRRHWVEEGVSQKPAFEKGKTDRYGLINSMVQSETEPGWVKENEYVSDADTLHIKVDGKLLRDSEGGHRLRTLINQEYARAYRKAGLTGIPNVPIRHGAHASLWEMFGEKDITGHTVDLEYLEHVGHPGPGFAIRVGTGGHVGAFDVPMSSIQSMLNTSSARFRNKQAASVAGGMGPLMQLPENWLTAPAETRSVLEQVGAEHLNSP